MRITGGALVRRKFLIPPLVDEGVVRPTPDRVREAVFSMLAFDIKGAFVVDLFAGSGAHGFESISRGALRVRFVEKDSSIASVIRENIASLGLKDKCELLNQDVIDYMKSDPDKTADVIFVDPPYAYKPKKEFFSLLLNHLSAEGVIVFRCHKKDEPLFDERLVVYRDRNYGGCRVFILRRALT